MDTLRPRSAEELASTLRDLVAAKRSIRVFGARTKDRMAGPIAAADCELSTAAMDRVLSYEPRDLTISVEPGVRWADLLALLARNGQGILIDPPFGSAATVGGVLASNTSGPRRLLYGSARDVVIGMKFATLEGKVIQSGGNVVKNVAGLDMAKLMIGSFGTLAVIASVNFKLTPLPEHSRTFVFSCASVDEAAAVRGRVFAGPLQPCAMDLLNAAAAKRVGLAEKPALLIAASGTSAVLDRFAKELTGASETLDGDDETRLWLKVREFTPAMLAASPDTVVVRTPVTLTDVLTVLHSAAGPAIARAATGVVYSYSLGDEPRLAGTIEFAPESIRQTAELWPSSGNSLGVMERIKTMFDPGRLLNRGRLYGRI